jgi:uncharacterized protein
MTDSEGILLGKAGDAVTYLLPKMANRHGLIAGATGTGKTVSLRVIAEQLSKLGVPCFVADVKGDLAGLARPGEANPKIEGRAKQLGLADFKYGAPPVVFWDVYAERGHPFRATISEMGPLLLSRLLQLNEIQEAVLYIAFKVADDNGLLLIDLKDLQALLAWMDQNREPIEQHYGKVSPASLASIQRGLLVLEQEGAAKFFGEPAISLDDLMQTVSGQGVVNILAAEKLVNKPKLYSTVLLWLLSELWEQLPEVGDPEKPRFVFFFDEAHLLFSDAPKALLEKIEQVTRLIRSKGVGVYYVTQNPLDVPDIVLGQLGNRVQHALRAFTPRDQKAVSAAADTFRSNPKVNVSKAITELGVGEALVSTLDLKGTPTPVERVLIRPPESRLGTITDEERRAALQGSLVAGTYDKVVDRESAYELLAARADKRLGGGAPAGTAGAPAGPGQSERPRIFQPSGQSSGGIGGMLGGIFGSGSGASSGRGRGRESIGEAMAKTAARAISGEVARRVVRGVLGGIFGGRR